MKFKVLGSLLFIVLCYNTSFGQSMTSDSGGALYLYKSETSNPADLFKRGYYVGPHVLGDTITMLLNAFEQKFTYFKKSEGAYATEEKVVLKRDIYRAINQVNNYYEKGVKKGRISTDEAYSKVKAILTTGVKLMDYNTTQVESQLRKIKSIQETENYLLSIKFRM